MPIEIVDLVPDFIRHVLSATDPLEGWSIYERLHAEVFDTYFSNRYWGDRGTMPVAVSRWKEDAGRIEAMARMATECVEGSSAAVSEVLIADHAAVRCVIFVGLFGANGFHEILRGVPTVFVALEKVPGLRIMEVLSAHELSHAYHSSLRAGTWSDSDVYQALFAEGLAVVASRLAFPGLPLEDYLWMGSPLTVPVARYEQGVEPLVGALLADPTYERFFNYDPARPPVDVLPRAGYYLGYVCAEAIASRWELAAMARWTPDRAVAEIKAALAHVGRNG